MPIHYSQRFSGRNLNRGLIGWFLHLSIESPNKSRYLALHFRICSKFSCILQTRADTLERCIKKIIIHASTVSVRVFSSDVIKARTFYEHAKQQKMPLILLLIKETRLKTPNARTQESIMIACQGSSTKCIQKYSFWCALCAYISGAFYPTEFFYFIDRSR